jgi:hypothetical protein
MKTWFWLALSAATLVSAPIARAQEEWREERHERFERLRDRCEDGDERACGRLEEMRRQWRGGGYEYRGGDRGPGGYPQPVPVAPQYGGGGGTSALCAQIQANTANCVTRQQANPGQHINCAPWLVQLKANRCM